jgi:hypothetical protein
VYLSNTEREALFLTGCTDPEPWMVAQAIEQAKQRGTYIQGEESLLLRLAEAEEYEARMQAARDEAAQAEPVQAEPAEEPQEEAPSEAPDESPAESAEAAAVAEESVDPVAPAVLSLASLDCPLPFDPGPEPAADQDFTSYTKAELIDYAFDMFGKTLDPAKRKDSLIAEVQALVDAGS